MFPGLRCGENVELSFMTPGESSEPFSGEGLMLCLQVDNVDKEYERLHAIGVPLVQDPKDNPWGDRSLIAMDPVGISVYVYQPIEPSPEFAMSFHP